MSKELNVEWVSQLEARCPKWGDSDDVVREKLSRLAEYVKIESNGYFQYDTDAGKLIQKKTLPWSCVFDVIKCGQEFDFVVLMDIKPRFKFKKPFPPKGMMFASYDEDEDAVRLKIYSGERREDLSGYDGYGREPDELEVVEGLRDRDGEWLEELEVKWE